MTFRRAVRSDALGIATVHTVTWQSAYRGLMPADFLASLSVDERTERWRSNLPERVTPPVDGVLAKCTWVALTHERVCGFCSLGPCRDAGDTGAEVYALYVHPGRWRGGVGAGLLALAEDEAVRAGSATLSLWTLRDNPQARGFYERVGYAIDGGARDEAVGGVNLAHVRYRKTLGRSLGE